MYTIAIDDPMNYLDGETFARENHSSLKELVNKKALAYVKTLTAKGGKPIPVAIDPMAIFVQEKYGL